MSLDRLLRGALAERADRIEMSTPDLRSVVASGRARRRRRRQLVAGATGGAILLGVILAIAPTMADDPHPALPGSTPSRPGAMRAIKWGVNDVVGHPAAEQQVVLAGDRNHRAGDLAPGDAAGSLTIWTRCELPPSRDPGPCVDPVPVVARSAVEVLRPGRAPFSMILPATPEMTHDGLIGLGVRYVGEGRFYLARPASVLVSADSAAPVALTTTDGTVTPRPGIRAVLCSAIPPYEMCELDVGQRTLTRIDLPSGVQWSPSTTIGMWGVRDRAVFWQALDGQIQTRTLPIYPSRRLNVPLDVPDGVIVVSESLNDGAIMGDVIHVSEDRGATWRTLLSPVGDHGDGRLPADWRGWPERRT